MRADIRALVKAFFLENMNNYLVVRHYNMLDINEADLPFSDFDGQTVCLFHTFDYADIKEPYEPFLPWVKYIYEEKYCKDYTPAEFLNACGVYYFHVELFEQYLSGQPVMRREEIIPEAEEMKYERKKMYENFCNIFSFIIQDYKIYMVIQHIHLADRGCLQLLEKIMSRIDSKNFKLMFLYNEQYRINDSKQDYWNSWYNYVVENKYEYEWTQRGQKSAENLSKKFVAEQEKVSDYIKKLYLMTQFLALDDALIFTRQIYGALDKWKKEISIEQVLHISYLYIYILLSLKDGDTAALAIEKVSKLCDHDENRESNYYYHYLRILYGFCVGKDKEVEASSRKAAGIAQAIGNDRLFLNAEVYRVMTKFAGWKELYLRNFTFDVDESLIKRLIEEKYYNALAYCYLFGYDNDFDTLKLIAEGKKEPVYFNRAVQICEYTKNNNLLLTAYMKYIIQFNKLDYHDFANGMHEKRLEVMRQEGEIIRIAHAYAGLGYNATIQEKYEEADKYLNDAIKIIYQHNIVSEVGEMLYNMAMTCFSARMYRPAIEILEILYALLEKINMMSIRLCSSCKLYTISSLSYYYLGEEYNSYRYYLKIENLVTSLLDESRAHEYSDSEWMYYYVCKAALWKDASPKEREKIYENLIYFYEKDTEEKYIFVDFLAREYSEFLRAQRRDGEADQFLLDKIAYCEKQKLQKKREELEYLYKNRQFPPAKPLDIGLKSLTKEQIISLADNEGIRLQLKERERDINFLRVCQEILNRDDLKMHELKEKVFRLLQNTYGLDSVISFQKKEDGYFLSYASSEIHREKVDYDAIYQYMKDYGHSFLGHWIDKNYSEFLPIEKGFEGKKRSTLMGIYHGRTDGVTLCAVSVAEKVAMQRTFLKEKTLFTIEFALEQMYVALERIQNREMLAQMKDKLEKMAVTDNLTGLYNRQGFALKNQEEQGGKAQCNVLLYVDLDNFKFYNDTYGHEIGDLVLKRFSEIFREVIEGKGYAVRYGGDEFLLVLEDSDEVQGVAVAKKIYDRIFDGFQNLLRDYMHTTIIIPYDKKISCSIGIATYLSGDKSHVFEALSKADELLYRVKKNGKGKYAIA